MLQVKLIRDRHNRVVATRPRLDNSLKWDRKNILHYVQDFESAKDRIEDMLRGVQSRMHQDSGLRVRHLVELVQVIFKMDRLDESGKKVFRSLVEATSS